MLIVLLVIIARRRLQFKKAMEKMDTADNREAVALRYGYAASLLAHSTAGPGRTAAGSADGSEGLAGPDGEAAFLNREAMFSHHEITDGQRKWMENYAGEVLEKCKKDWSFGKKLKYKLWECLY